MSVWQPDMPELIGFMDTLNYVSLVIRSMYSYSGAVDMQSGVPEYVVNDSHTSAR